MQLFVDTSSLFKFYYPEPDSDQVETCLLAADRVVISELSRIEFSSVAARKVRMQEMSRAEHTLLMSAFDEDCLAQAFWIVGLSGDVLAEARILVDRLGMDNALRTLDSIQLASAMRSGAESFLCHDQRLRELARQVGLNLHET